MKQLMKGNFAMAEGAIRAGCRIACRISHHSPDGDPEYSSSHMAEVGGQFRC